MTLFDYRLVGGIACIFGWAFLIFQSPLLALVLFLLAFGCFVYVLYKDHLEKSE